MPHRTGHPTRKLPLPLRPLSDTWFTPGSGVSTCHCCVRQTHADRHTNSLWISKSNSLTRLMPILLASCSVWSHNQTLATPKIPCPGFRYKMIPITYKLPSLALSAIFILSLHIIYCLLCFFICSCALFIYHVVWLGLPLFHFPNLGWGPGWGSGAEPPADGHPGVSPPENFCNSYVIWCILTQSGGSYLQAAGPSTFVALQ